MKIITLGTGAGRPTLKRWAAAVGLEFSGETFLFDCGEGAQLQLMCSPLKWGKLRAIFIGHLHGDHLYGLPGLLSTMSMSGRQNLLQVFGPKGLKAYIDAHLQSAGMWVQFPLEVQEITQAGLLLDEKKYQIATEPLEHTITCWGFVFREKARPGIFDEAKARQLGLPEGAWRRQLVEGHAVTLPNGVNLKPQDFVGASRPGRSVAYCCDTRPCPAVLRLGMDVDLLIHESTFADVERSDAHAWGHSTASDAAKAALACNAKHLVLTHISQRYQEIDEGLLLKEAGAIFPELSLAADRQIFSVPAEASPEPTDNLGPEPAD